MWSVGPPACLPVIYFPSKAVKLTGSERSVSLPPSHHMGCLTRRRWWSKVGHATSLMRAAGLNYSQQFLICQATFATFSPLLHLVSNLFPHPFCPPGTGSNRFTVEKVASDRPRPPLAMYRGEGEKIPLVNFSSYLVFPTFFPRSLHPLINSEWERE